MLYFAYYPSHDEKSHSVHVLSMQPGVLFHIGNKKSEQGVGNCNSFSTCWTPWAAVWSSILCHNMGRWHTHIYIYIYRIDSMIQSIIFYSKNRQEQQMNPPKRFCSKSHQRPRLARPLCWVPFKQDMLQLHLDGMLKCYQGWCKRAGMNRIPCPVDIKHTPEIMLY